MKICLSRDDGKIPFDLFLTSYFFYPYICTADANSSYIGDEICRLASPLTHGGRLLVVNVTALIIICM